MFEHAEMVGLIRTVLILLLIYYGFKIFARVVLPWLLKLFVKKVERKINNQMNNQYRQPNDGFEQAGNVYVKRPKSDSKTPKDLDGGEYVDFEEVEK
ncbi:MAG: DUF4834 family protein [Flavobacteriales bacterium]|nr:DUF4834 family protein [Flavobacteriales bacterium]